MKAKREHRVPLCDRALEVLEAARGLGDGNPLVFPMRSERPISTSTLLKTLNDLRAALGVRAGLHERRWGGRSTSALGSLGWLL